MSNKKAPTKEECKELIEWAIARGLITYRRMTYEEERFLIANGEKPCGSETEQDKAAEDH